jgi:hypothetical protein
MTMYWDVEDVETVSDFSLMVRFRDGLTGKIQCLPSFFRGVFTSINTPELFAQARVQDGVLTWPNELDLAPDAMYQAIKTKGVWLLE